MTLIVTGPEALVQALRALCRDIERGVVVGCELTYEPTCVATLKATYLTGEADTSSLPGLPGVRVLTVDEEGDTAPGKGQR